MIKHIFKLFCRILVFLSLAVATIFVISCSAALSQTQLPNEIAKNPETYFCPRNDCGKVLESSVNSANSSVHCAVYDINLKNVIGSLSEKSRTADVKIVMDGSNSHGQIKGNGMRVDTDNQLMHNKFCVIDKRIVLTGSFNPTENDNLRNNNNLIVIYSKSIAENYEDEFGELWNGIFGGGNKVRHPVAYVNGIKIENYFCPEDNCASHIAEMIYGAKSSVYFMDFSFTSSEIANAIIAKKSLDTKGVVDSMQAAGKFSQLKALQQAGVNVKKDSNKYKMHHKVFIVDNETIATGSFNPTVSGDDRNDENILIIHDRNITRDYLKEFDEIFK